MDHTDGKPWEVEVWNMLEDPGGGNDVVNFQSVARYYEQKTRAIMTVPHMGKMKDDDLIGIEPHDRMFPTGFYQPKGDFKGTLLSCIDLVYCDGADKATPYNEWRGTLHTTVEANTKRFISEICAGYYVKLNTNSKPMKEKTSWAVLYAFRPWGSHFGEPQVAVMEMKEGQMIKGAPVKNVNAPEIVAIGGLTNSLCVAVTAWLTANMPCFKSIRTNEQLAKGATPRSEADVGRALEGSLGVLNQKKLRERYVSNMRAYTDELIANERCLLGIREGNVQWTKVEENEENEVMTSKINKATTAFDKWWIRQLLRGFETISVVTEFGPNTEFHNTIKIFQDLMTDHEEEILKHLTTLDYDNADVAKAYTLLPLNQAIHTLTDEEKIKLPVYVPVMFADVFVAMATQTTADDKTAQLKDATAWVPKQMRLNYKKMQEFITRMHPEPDWVKEIKAKRAKEEADLEVLGGSRAMAAAFNRIGMRTGKPAPGDPGGLAASKPIEQAKAKKFDPKKRGLDQLPIKWVDDFENFDDGKTNKTRLVGTWARFATGSEGRTKKQLHRWCVCDQSKDPANKQSATYPGHFVSTQGSSNNSSAHPNQGKDGCSFNNFTPDPDKAGPGSAKGKGKHGASAATSSASVTVADADLNRATAHIENLQNQIRMLAAARDAEHLKYAKATELANTQLSLQAQKTNELISAHAKTLRSSQLETFQAIAKIREIRGHAEGFAESMLAKATQGEPPDMDAAWSAFSGLLSKEQLEHARWRDVDTKKLPGSRSKDVFNINAFQVADTAAPPTPIQHTVHQLTDAKVIVQPTPDGYAAPVDPSNFLLPWATGARGKKRKRTRYDGDDDSDAASADDDDEEEEENDDDGGSQ